MALRSQGSEKYGTSVMNDEEVLIYMDASVENGTDITGALKDMRMVDTLLHMKRLHQATGYLKKNKSGFVRKGSALSDLYNGIIDARVKDLI